MPTELAIQTKNAFDFIQKLYFEISYLIKEVEGLLQQEEEKFVINRKTGYAVTTKSSTGLEPQNVENWLYHTLTVFFCPENLTRRKGGVTVTNFNNKLKLLLLHIDLIDKDINEPRVLSGFIYNIKSKRETTKKVENIMWTFAYNPKKVFSKFPEIVYEDSNCSFQGKCFLEKLFSIKDSDDVVKKLIEPMLSLYRNHQ
jgi:hypothetical protein